MDRTGDKILLWAILFLAVGVRLAGVNYGLPHLYHADEPIIVNLAVAYGTGDLNPHYFKMPPFMSYLTFFIYGLYYLVGKVLGWFHGTNDFANLFLTDPSSFYLIGRLLWGIVLGTASVYAMHQLIKKKFSVKHAILSAFFLSVSFLHVRDSHFIYFDIPLVLLLILCFFPILEIVTRPEKIHYVAFGILMGLAAGVKYNGSFVVVPFLAAHFLKKKVSWKSLFDVNLWLAGALCMATFIMTNPYVILDFPSFHRDLSAMKEFEGYIGLSHHIVYSTVSAHGIPLMILGALGIVRALVQRDKMKVPMAVFITLYYILLGCFGQLHDRYILPTIPFFLFFAGDALLWIQKQFRFQTAGLVVLALLATAPTFAKTVWCDQLLIKEDARTMAQRWVESNLPEGARIAIDDSFFSPRLKQSRQQLEIKLEEALGLSNQRQIKRLNAMVSLAKNDPDRRFELYYLADAPGDFFLTRPTLPYQMEALKKAGINYLIVTKIKENFRRDFYDTMIAKHEGRLLKRFSPYKDPNRQWPISPFAMTGAPSIWKEFLARQRNGQIIEIYQL